MAENEITITGNLTRAPELRFTTSGTATCSFGVAQNRRYMQNNEWVDAPTNFFSGSVWGKYGENVAAAVAKGDRVVVKGRLDFRKYTNRDGVEVATHDIVADEVAPSLKYATAAITRIQRDGGSPRQQQRRDGTPDPVYGDESPY